ncbi:ABC transporter permease subunit, partial [Escherichia coli]|uniref:ABC transporter permease subunit n=1 Tax=Escherichia coli TaxID=562 RepID=UPI001CDA936F
EWVHVQLHQQKGMISLSPPTICNSAKNSAIASTIGLVDMAAQAGKLLDYSAHAWESFTAITLAYVLINAFIMLVMTLVERKVRLPGNMGGK